MAALASYRANPRPARTRFLPAKVAWIAVLLHAVGPGTVSAALAAAIDGKEAYLASQAVIGKPVGDHALRDRSGRSVRLSDYRGKPLLVSFVYTGCFETCPTDTLRISRAVGAAQDLLGSEVFNIVSIGFNVPFDSPDAMAAFSRQHGIGARNWEFLSPDIASVAALTRDFGFTYLATPKGFDHITQLSVLDARGRIYRQLYGDGLNAQSIVAALRDMNNGLVPVAQGWSGLVARVRLLCSVYDKGSDTYRADYSLIFGFLAGASILGGVIYLLLSEWWRQRRRPRPEPRAIGHPNEIP